MPIWLTDFNGIAAIIAAIASMISAVRAGKAADQLKPDHGNSVKDVVEQIDDKVSSVGHQVGEIRADATVWHSDFANRIRQLERRTLDCPKHGD